MTWSSFFLVCFVFGFALSVLSFLAGSLHLPHLHMHIHHGAHGGHAGQGTASRINFGTISAFVTWFGGAGYILTRLTATALFLVVLVAVVAGVAGASIIFLFVARVLTPGDRPLDPADYRLIGMLGMVSSPVGPNGTGEMIFVQQGRRLGVPIRSEGGAPIPAGKEVVVTRYERGIAYVREWEELTA